MPNWCSNKITITGEPSVLSELLQKSKTNDSEFSLEPFFDIPKDEKDLYTWCTTNWGTKWDLSDVDLDKDKIENGIIVIHCETAWSPPDLAFNHISSLYPTLTFENFFMEEGNDVCGFHKVSNSIIFEQDGKASDYTGFYFKIDFTKIKDAKNENISIPITISSHNDVQDAFINKLNPNCHSESTLTLNLNLLHKFLNKNLTEIDLTKEIHTLTMVEQNFEKDDELLLNYLSAFIEENCENIITSFNKEKLDQTLTKKELATKLRNKI